jgi:hypothetical protein
MARREKQRIKGFFAALLLEASREGLTKVYFDEVKYRKKRIIEALILRSVFEGYEIVL